ncbi:MAG: TspO/MBR family protein [Flavipsychrobacter sp.]
MNTDISKVAGKLKWWHFALIAAGVSFIGGLSGGTTKKQEIKLYNKKNKQAPWAPPSWLFAPAWTFNNFFLIKALIKILNKENVTEKRRLMLLQGAIWAIFFSFNYIYFRKKSPIMAATWTMADAVLATASLILALKKDKKLALDYLPLVLWTGYASTVADYQALKNPDPVFHTPPMLN